MIITPVRKIVIGIVGVALVLLGIAGLVLPFLPGWLLIIAGLAVLRTEYVWAKQLTEGAQRRANNLTRKSDGPNDLAA
jgi:uncharacterized membrane protein YbaN (DUF454 family)